MLLYSTNNTSNVVTLKEAVLNAFPTDRGLYVPAELPILDDGFLSGLSKRSFHEICIHISQQLLMGSLNKQEIENLVTKAINFPAPLKRLEDHISSLELFHGPTMAFKDFGARFMAMLMSHFLQNENKKTTILVATSGDTGGAVAAGFYGLENIDVIILYPSGKISPLQEKQLTSWGKNIRAIEVKGVFDDCQSLVKAAFLDADLNEKYSFSSANSINIARLIPQSFYYFEAFKQLESGDQKVIFSVPSGNFGNLTAGLFAKKMGLNIHQFIAATNSNKTFYDYINTGTYTPRPSIATLSNAMDVGDPSNFIRIMDLFGSTWNLVKEHIICRHYSDSQTRASIRDLYDTFQYVADPHGAIAYQACLDHMRSASEKHQYVFLETAHPAKFTEVVGPIIEKTIKLPEQLKRFNLLEGESLLCANDFNSFKQTLINL